jgi:hypothetical protein
MLRVKYAPPDEMSAFIDAAPRGSVDPPARFLTHLRAGSMGELALRVVDSEGASVPALVNLIHQGTGALYQPSGAIEFAPMMSDIAGEPVPSACEALPGRGGALRAHHPG